jgi:TorA maturation chaperone TorD
MVGNQASADTYLLLAMLLRLPNEEFVTGLKNGMFVSSVKQLIGDLALSHEGQGKAQEALRLFESCAHDDVTLSQLRSEYTYLFDHPDMPAIQRFEGLFLHFAKHPDLRTYVGAPPRFINPAALDAERCYKKAGFKRSSLLNEPADSLSAELEFMHRLSCAKIDALESNDFEKAAYADECVTEFKRIHLRKWAIPFFEACAQRSRISFYQATGLLGGAFMAEMLKEDKG